MSYQRKITYRTGLFDPVNLNSVDKIADSLCQFEAVLNEENYIQALDDLLDKAQIVELVLSGMPLFKTCKPYSCANFKFIGMNNVSLNTWIIKHFPTTHDLFLSSFENKLLCKLSKFHYFRTSSHDVDYNLLHDHFQTVSLAPEAFGALFAMTSLKEEGHPHDVGLSSFKKVKAKSQKQLKMKKTHVHEPNINTKSLVDLNIAIPRTSHDAQAALTMLLGHLKDILEVCAL